MHSKTPTSVSGVEAHRKAHGKFLETIIVKQGLKSTLVNVSTVSAFLSKDHYTFLLKDDGAELICDLSLNHLEERLDPSRFRRLHRNNIVSTQAVRSVIGGPNMEIELANKVRLPVSRSNRVLAEEIISSRN